MLTTLPKLKIAIVDDHALFRSALALLLEHQSGCEVIAELDTLDAIHSTLACNTLDIIFLDYHLPQGDALATAQKIKENHHNSKVVFLTGAQSSYILEQLIDSQADGILHKEIRPEELQQALETIYNGGKAISKDVLSKISGSPALFSGREFQLFQLLAKGLSSKQAADILNISSRTVEKHRENLFKKGNVSNLAQLIELGYKWKILDLESGT